MSDAFEVSAVEELLTLMEHWGIAELRLTIGQDALDLVREAPGVAEGGAAAAAEPAHPAVAEAPGEEQPPPMMINAPVVGIFRLARSGFPQGEPRAGDHVRAGQVIGTIELMRVPNDLLSPATGVIEAVLVEDGTGVEFGHPVMAIRPFEEVSEDEAAMLPPPTW